MSDIVTYQADGEVAVITLDDGKANVLSHEVLAAAHDALDRAEAKARAVVLAGRPGYLSGGFDLKEMTAGLNRSRDLVIAGARLHHRVFLFPKPVIIAATGHAVAAGAILLLVGDWNVGAAGAFRIGLPETAIGMPLPRFAIDFARFRLHTTHFTRATLFAEMYSPEGALAAGYLDEVTAPDQTVARAVEVAGAGAAQVHQPAFALSKHRAREALGSQVAGQLVDDVTELTTGARG